ncbi:ribonuclease H-like domain-containing protein [Tanacetum coccineum]
MKNNVKQTEFESGVTKDLNHKNFFDNENPKSPNDEGRVSSNDDGTELSPNINQGNDDYEATSMDETNNTHPEGTVSDETDFINEFYENLEFNTEIEELLVNTLRRSSRQTKLPSSLNDFVVEGKVKYGVEKVVNYANLNHDNYCFISALNKSVEPTCYKEAILDSNWIDAMNAEIEALNENNTWVITNLPPNRKEGIDFDETFSPVVKMSTVRCVIALYVTNCWPLFQLDINNAFLYGDLDEDIYMTIPKGFASKYNKNKNTLSKSSTEAEYRSLSSAACEIIWIQKLLLDLGIKVTLPVNLHCDNKSALQLAINPAFHERSKHFEIDCLKEASHSSVEAKYHGVVNVMAETHWLQNLLRKLHSPLHLATIVYCDNVSAIYLSFNLVHHQCTKHIEIDIYFVRDHVATRQVRALHVPLRYQYAHIFTKGLPFA